MYGVRGLGLNCPGDPGCPGNVQAVDSQNVCDPTSASFDANICNNLYVPRSPSITQTLSANATPILLGAGALLLLLGMRR